MAGSALAVPPLSLALVMIALVPVSAVMMAQYSLQQTWDPQALPASCRLPRASMSSARLLVRHLALVVTRVLCCAQM